MGFKKRKSSNDDKSDHGQEKRKPSTDIEGLSGRSNIQNIKNNQTLIKHHTTYMKLNICIYVYIVIYSKLWKHMETY